MSSRAIQTTTCQEVDLENHPSGVCGLNAKKALFGKQIYRILAEHQSREDWECQPLVRELQTWAERMNAAFGLCVPEVSLRVDWLPWTRLGHFRPGHNGFGLKGEIALNRRHLESREFPEVLGTLFHELLHAWQQAHGTPGRGTYHNKEFRLKAREYGLVIDERGHTGYEPQSRFTEMLSRYGVEVPELPALSSTATRRVGNSKLKLWMCGCTRVRVAVADFQAICLRCRQRFERVP